MEEIRFAERLALANRRIDGLRFALQKIIESAELNPDQAASEIAKEALRIDDVKEEAYQELKAKLFQENPTFKPTIKF